MPLAFGSGLGSDVAMGGGATLSLSSPVGIAMIVLPGPAFIVIPIGLGILATEFVWAARLLQQVKERVGKAAAAVKRKASR